MTMRPLDLVPLRTKAFKHQTEKFDHYYGILRERRFLMIEHEMGLGKTRTSIHLTLTLLREGLVKRLFIIAPKAICSTWVDQLQTHAGITGTSFQWSSTKASTDKAKREFQNMLRSALPVFIVNVEAFQSKNPQLQKWCDEFQDGTDMLILDESSKIKDVAASRTKALQKIAPRSGYRLCLTGVMAPESPLNVYAQFQFLDQKFWKGSWWNFRTYYSIMQDRYVAEGRIVKVVVGYRNVASLCKIIDPFTWRLRKADCLDLPEKIHVPVIVDLSKEERDAYDTMKRELVLELQSGDVVTAASKVSLFAKARQFTGGFASPDLPIKQGTPTKLAWLLSDLEETGENAIIWTEYRHEVKMLKEALSKLGPTGIFSGVQDDHQNELDKKAFEEGKLRFFVADTGKGARGLNLQGHCSLQYFYSLTLSADEYGQSLDRTHRIGQTKTCVYKYPLARSSVDERIYELLQRKVNIAQAFSAGKLDLISLL